MAIMWRPPKLKEFIPYIEWYYTIFLDAYRKRVTQYYFDDYHKHPSSFPFMSATTTFSIFCNSEVITLFTLNNEGDKFLYKYDLFDSFEEYKVIDDMPEHIKKKRLLEITSLDNYLFKDYCHYGENDDPSPIYYERAPKFQGSQLADRHFYTINKENNDAEFQLFNFNSIIKKVNNENFSYELEEAINTYKHGFFLASMITAAVALETMLKNTVIIKLGPKFLPDQIYTSTLSNILLKNEIIDERLYHRIRALNELRRSGAHSKSGKANEWDAKQVLTGLNIIVNSIY